MTIVASNDAVYYIDATGRSRNAEVVVATMTGDYASGAIPITASSGNVAAAVATATLAGAVGLTTYITGFEVTGAGATAPLVVNVTVTGTVSGTLTYTYTAATGATVPNQPLIVQFAPPIPASATNTAIVVSCPSLGAGNTNNTVVAHGYRK